MNAKVESVRTKPRRACPHGQRALESNPIAASFAGFGGNVFYIASDNPAAAERFGHRLIVEAESIALQPHLGRTVPEFGDVSIRERIFRNYRIVYRLDASQSVIIVSRFWHAARDKPDLSEE